MKYLLFILYPLKDLSVTAALILMTSSFFPVSTRRLKLRIPLCAVTAAVISTVGLMNPMFHTTQQYEYLDLISFAFCLFAVFFILKKPPAGKTVMLAVLLISTVDMIWSFIGSFLPFGNESTEILLCEYAFGSLAGIITSTVFVILKNKNLGGAVVCAADGFPKWIIWCIFAFELACYYREFGMSETVYGIMFALSACLIVGCMVFLFFRIQKLVGRQEEIYRRLNEQLEYSGMLRKSDEELRAFRHDLKNHLIVLDSYFKSGEYEKASEYFDTLSENSGVFQKRFSTGNHVADSILSVKSEEADIDFDGIIPEKLISPDDICVILGNLLDNAVRACSQIVSQNRNIHITSRVRNGNLILTIKNPDGSESQEKVIHRKPATTKADKKNHGIGLSNVHKAVEKYNGTMELYSKNGIFTAEIILNGGTNS